MPRNNSIAVFIAATSALTIAVTDNLSLKAGENDLGIKRVEYRYVS